MSVSNKVALYAMLPATGILLFGLASIFIYPTTIEAKVSIVSSIATSVTVLFLISERLRDSALRKLEFLNRRALSPSLRASRGRGQSIGEEQSRTFAQSTELLKGHGRFLRLKLYPKNLITTLDNAAKSVAAYSKLRQSVIDAGSKVIGQQQFNIWAVLAVLGFEDKGNYNDQLIEQQREVFETLKKTDAELCEQFPIKCREVLEIKAVIYKKLVNFFADNQLEEAREPPAYPYVPVGAGLPPYY